MWPAKTGPISTDGLCFLAALLRMMKRTIEYEIAVHKRGVEILPPFIGASLIAVSMPTFINMIMRAAALGAGR